MALHGSVLLLIKGAYFYVSKLSASFRAHLARSQAPSAVFLLINTEARSFFNILICFLCRIFDTFCRLPLVAAGCLLPAKFCELGIKKRDKPSSPYQDAPYS